MLLNFIFVILVQHLCCHAEIMFPKDLSTEFIFPPKHRRSGTGLPDGHLRPLGNLSYSAIAL